MTEKECHKSNERALLLQTVFMFLPVKPSWNACYVVAYSIHVVEHLSL